jgi:hypothetical protein
MKRLFTGEAALVLTILALSENSLEVAFYAAFLVFRKATYSVLVTAMRFALSSR